MGRAGTKAARPILPGGADGVWYNVGSAAVRRAFGPPMLKVSPRIQIPLTEFDFSFARSSGPGGQNVNKVSSKAILRWPVTASVHLPPDVRARFLARFSRKLTVERELVVSSQRYRDQGRNIADCLEKVREMLLAVAEAPRKRRPTKPSRSSQARRLEHKQAHSAKKRQRRTLGDE